MLLTARRPRDLGLARRFVSFQREVVVLCLHQLVLLVFFGLSSCVYMDPSQSHHPTRRRSLGNLSASRVFPGMWPLALVLSVMPLPRFSFDYGCIVDQPPRMRDHGGLLGSLALLVVSAAVTFVFLTCVTFCLSSTY